MDDEAVVANPFGPDRDEVVTKDALVTHKVTSRRVNYGGGSI